MKKKYLGVILPLLLIGVFLFSSAVLAEYGDTTTFVSQVKYGDGLDKMDAYLDFPEDVTVDSNGNFYIADTYNNVIRKINTSGVVSTMVGTGAYGDVNSQGYNSQLSLPSGVAVNSDGSALYIADTENNKIKKMKSNAVITLVSDLNNPEAVELSGSTLYFLDTGNNALKKVSVDGGSVTTITSSLDEPKKMHISGSYAYVVNYGNGSLQKVNLTSGARTTIASGFENNWGIVIDGNYAYVSDGDGYTDIIQKVNLSSGTKTTFADDSNMVSINFPTGLTIYNGNLYVANAGIGTIHEFDLTDSNTNEIWAGKERFQNADGTGNMGLIGRPREMTMSPDGDYIYLIENNKISTITVATGEREYLTASSVDNYREHTGVKARFSSPAGLTINSAGDTLYITDRWNNRVRKVDIASTTTELISGTGLTNMTGSQTNGYLEGTKNTAQFNQPIGIALSADENYLYVTDTANNKIRKIRISDGQTWLVASGFNKPYGLAIDSSGENLYVADTNNHQIKKIDLSDNSVSIVAGSGSNGYLDAVGTSAYFSYPSFIDMGQDGNLYVSEVGSNRIRIIDPVTKSVRLVAGSGEKGYLNGSKTVTKFNNPAGMVADTANNKLYLADEWNDVIRRIDISGEAPYTIDAPEPASVSPSSIEQDSGRTSAMVLVLGDNFYTIHEVYFGSVEATNVYMQSSTSMAVDVPFDQLAPGYYDVLVKSDDGQCSILAKGFGVSENGAIPNITYTVDTSSCDLQNGESSDDEIAPGKSFMAYADNLRGEWFLASGDLTGDSAEEVVTGTGAGMGPQVRVFDEDGNEKFSFFAYDSSFRGGVRVAVGDVDGDGVSDIVTAPGQGGNPHIRVFDNQGNAKYSFFALDGKFKGGAFIALGDVNGDSKNEIVITAGAGGGPHVTVHKYDGTVLANFMAYGTDFRYGIRPACLDFDNDNKDEIITGPDVGAPHIQMFSVRTGYVHQLNPGFYAFDASYRGGVSVVGADIDGDKLDEIVVGVGLDAQPEVKVYNKYGTEILWQFYAFSRTYTGGVNISSGDIDSDGKDEILVSPRSNGGPNVRIIGQ